MSAAIKLDPETLETVIATATPEQRRYLVEQLLPKVVEDDGYLPRLVLNKKGDLVGVLIPEFRSTATDPPKLSEAEYAELQRRINSPGELITHEQLLQDLGLADIPAPRRL